MIARVYGTVPFEHRWHRLLLETSFDRLGGCVIGPNGRGRVELRSLDVSDSRFDDAVIEVA